MEKSNHLHNDATGVLVVDGNIEENLGVGHDFVGFVGEQARESDWYADCCQVRREKQRPAYEERHLGYNTPLAILPLLQQRHLSKDYWRSCVAPSIKISIYLFYLTNTSL